jgi:hypothetical protein
MNISVRLEGGLGDCLLGNRFVCAIKEKYPDSSITAYIDSEGETFQKQGLEILYPSYYKEIKVIQKKKYKDFWVNCQFGLDKYIGALENVPDDIRAEMESYDKFYDLHIDSLKWCNFDFDWMRYYRFFPKPDLNKITPTEDYIIFHLVSNSKNVHRLEQEYINNLIKETSSFCKVKLICTSNVRFFYSKFENDSRVDILNGDLKDVFLAISGAKCMFSIDSGLKYVGYAYDIPTLCMGRQVAHPHFPYLSHQIRWMPFPETCLPLNYDYFYVCDLMRRILKNKANILVPKITEFDSQAIRRIYSVNTYKSILNN